MTTSTTNPTTRTPSRPRSSPSESQGDQGALDWPARLRRIPGSIIIGAVALAAVGLGYFILVQAGGALSTGSQREFPLTASAKRINKPILISSGGELTSADAVEVICELEGQDHKIVEMLPEGSHVQEGEVVLWLDSSAINDQLSEQQIEVTQAEATAKAAAEQLKIERNLAESQIAQAELALELAELDKEKYVEGDYQVELNELQGSIALAKAKLQDAEAELEHFQDLVKKGFRTPEQLRSKEQAVKEAEFNLNRDEERLNVLEIYTRKRELTEFDAKATEADRELERAKSSATATLTKAETDLEVAVATAEMERKQLERIEKQLELCEVRATSDGSVVYAKEKNKSIEVGGTVHYKQKLFSVPSSEQMQVDAFVHESVVEKVRPGMPATIRVDAFPNLLLHGSTQKVANHYDSTRQWMSGGVKEYATTIVIEEAPQDVALRAGMTAEVQIEVGRLDNSLVVPLSGVTEHEGRHYAFVVSEGAAHRRPVSIGTNTPEVVEIVDGLEEGDRVTLDARRRADSEEDDDEDEDAAAPDSLSAQAG